MQSTLARRKIALFTEGGTCRHVRDLCTPTYLKWNACSYHDCMLRKTLEESNGRRHQTLRSLARCQVAEEFFFFFASSLPRITALRLKITIGSTCSSCVRHVQCVNIYWKTTAARGDIFQGETPMLCDGDCICRLLSLYSRA